MASFLNALLLLMVAVAATASAHTTVVTTTVVAEEESCAAEMQQKMPLRMCAMWMKSNIGANLEECCAELARFGSGCRCDAVKAVAATSVRYGPMEEMRRRACSLPGKCRGLSHCSCGGGGGDGGGAAFFG